MKRVAPVLLILTAAVACGGSGGGTPTSPAVPTTDTFSGTTMRVGGGCGGDSHTVTAREGTMSVTLVSTSDPNGGVSIQICSGNDAAGNCAVPQQRITVGQTLSGERQGTSTQVVKALPWGCVFGGIDASPVTYTLSVSYLK